MKRRSFLSGVAASALLPKAGLLLAEGGPSTTELARDETFWAKVAARYDRTDGIVNLEHGYWGKMARPVQEAYLSATRMVNQQNSYYARREFDKDALAARDRIAGALGVNGDEMAITRNASEAMHNLLRQHRGLGSGDAVLYADVDYPNFKATVAWLAEARGARSIELKIPSRADQDMLFTLYRDALDANPDLKVMLVTHVSNQHGLVLPVARIAAEAKKRGVDVICDSAQSWGLLDYRLPELGVDWAVFNLHKWIGAPVGTGALYMRRGSLEKVAPYPAMKDPENTSTEARVHLATTNFAAILAIPDALDFHLSVGAANKEARLRYLRSLWTAEALRMKHIEVLGGLDEPSWSGLASFRRVGESSRQDAIDLQLQMEREFGIFTVARHGLASGSCVRITPQVFNTPADMKKLVSALQAL
ncbi:MAG: aminotransferase class V-fold PLP-dependent enzyme [Xanthomonadales bacterium]|nr:aminotransferase class V-fold PLP-dependent enzyme [Xanthomonadales bacterium]